MIVEAAWDRAPKAAIFSALLIGLLRRRSAEAEVELKAVQPRDMRVDVLAFQAVGKALVVLPELPGIGGVVVGDHDRVVADSQVALQARQERLGQVAGIPAGVRFAQATAQLVEQCLCDQGRRHLPVADVEVQGSRAVPAQGLMRVEELLDVPAFGIVQRQGIDFIPVGSGKKGPEAILAGRLSRPLGELEVGFFRAMRHLVELLGRGESGPTSSEPFGIKGEQLPP